MTAIHVLAILKTIINIERSHGNILSSVNILAKTSKTYNVPLTSKK